MSIRLYVYHEKGVVVREYVFMQNNVRSTTVDRHAKGANNSEYLFVKIINTNTSNTIVEGVYNPPDNDLTFII